MSKETNLIKAAMYSGDETIQNAILDSDNPLIIGGLAYNENIVDPDKVVEKLMSFSRNTMAALTRRPNLLKKVKPETLDYALECYFDNERFAGPFGCRMLMRKSSEVESLLDIFGADRLKNKMFAIAKEFEKFDDYREHSWIVQNILTELNSQDDYEEIVKDLKVELEKLEGYEKDSLSCIARANKIYTINDDLIKQSEKVSFLMKINNNAHNFKVKLSDDTTEKNVTEFIDIILESLDEGYSRNMIINAIVRLEGIGKFITTEIKKKIVSVMGVTSLETLTLNDIMTAEDLKDINEIWDMIAKNENDYTVGKDAYIFDDVFYEKLGII